jgi:hypothetical protein
VASLPWGIRFDGGAGGGNTLVLVDTAAADTLLLTPDHLVFDATQVVGFTNVQSVRALGEAGDTAYLFNGPGGNASVSTPTYTALSGPGLDDGVAGFGTVTAFANPGGSDPAYFYGSDASDPNAQDLFLGTPSEASLRGNFGLRIASGFASVRATATNPHSSAVLFDSAGDDVLLLDMRGYAYLTGRGYLNLVVGFYHLDAFASTGNDSASIFTSGTGSTQLTSSPGRLNLTGQGAFSDVVITGFAQVATFGTSHDRASLAGAPGANALVGTPGYVTLSWTRYLTTVSGFGEVTSLGLFDANNAAYLYDSPGDDTFTGHGAEALLSGPGYSYDLVSFDYVRATSSAGGSDHINLGAIDYVFQPFGNWQ